LFGIVFWLCALLLVCIYPAGKLLWANRPVLFVIALPLFLPGWLAFVYLRYQDFYAFHVLLLLALVAASDIGAYFAGRAFGKHKLAKTVSPNKTWEGFAGGLLVSCALILVIALVFISQFTPLAVQHWLKLVLAALLIAASSVVGDLFESMIKRYRDVKDSGSLLPGHGGMLDRIDGLTAAAPVYALLLILMQQDFP
jgi:phosphatidate cytidylyltransferase